MTKYFTVEPLSPGTLGPNTKMKTVEGEDVIEQMHIIFDYFPEHFFEISNIYFVSDELKSSFDAIGATGVEYGVVQVTIEEYDFNRNAPGKTMKDIPKFFYLKNVGTSGVDDFGFKRDVPRNFCLAVSQRVLNLINESGMDDLITEEWKG